MSDDLELGLCVTAFLFDAMMSVMAAEGDVDPRTEEFLYRTISPALMKASGFLDPSGSTSPLYAVALEQGRRRLASELPPGHGGGLCRRLWSMAAVDGEVTEMEIATIRAYGAVVGVDAERNDELGVDVLTELTARRQAIRVAASWKPAIAG